MFTGIIEEVGEVRRLESMGGGVRLLIAAPNSIRELGINDSVAVNGVCLTVTSTHGDAFETETVEETLKKTTLGGLKPGSKVNLELPMRLNERLGGHLVLGHVDSVGRIIAREDRQNSWMFSISIPSQFTKYIIPVGSISIDGVSLTVAEIDREYIRVSIIPHTMEKTIFKWYKVGDSVNLEFDVVGKYIERLMTGDQTQVGQKFFTEEQLREMGY
jgi:riboflavin synthase